MLTGVSHMGFTVADVRSAAAFYERLFGAPRMSGESTTRRTPPTRSAIRARA